MLYSCIRMATVDVKGLRVKQKIIYEDETRCGNENGVADADTSDAVVSRCSAIWRVTGA